MSMKIANIYEQKQKHWDHLRSLRQNSERKTKTCAGCGKEIEVSQLKQKLYICDSCGYYFAMSPQKRLRLICDGQMFREMYRDLKSNDPLKFPGYEEKLAELREKTGREDAVVTGTARIGGEKAAIAVLDGRFLMGSMGTVVGEKIVRLTEYAQRRGLPLIIFSASGGARMQEGMFSLMQMAKTSAAIERYKSSGGLFISVLTNPTTGGVSASYASLGDIIIAEPRALICFAGPRVIEQTIGQKLPDGFQKAEFLLDHGMIDLIVEREELKETLSRLLKLHKGGVHE